MKVTAGRLCFLLLWILLTRGGALPAQTPALDSLQHLLKTDIPDSTKYRLYNIVVFDLSRIDSEKALELSNEMMDLARSQDNYRQEIVAHYNHAVIYRNMGKYELALPHIEEYLDFRRSIADTIGLGHGSYQLALLQRLRGKFDESMQAYNDCIKYYQHTGDQTGVALALNGRAVLYRKLNDPDRAIEEHKRALVINKAINRRSGILSCYANIGSCLAEKGNFGEAIKYYELQMQFAREDSNIYNIGAALENLGNMYRELGQYEQARQYYLQSKDIREQMGHQRYIMSVYRQLAELGILQNQFSEAEKYARDALNIASANNMSEEIGHCYLTMVHLYQAAGDYRQALDYQQAYQELRDSVLNSEITGQMAEMDARFANQEKQQEIAMLSAENQIKDLRIRQSRTGLIVAVLGLLVLGLLAIQMYRSRKRIQRLNLQLREQKDVIAEALHEKEVLLREIHHRVKNNLQVISSLLGIQSRSVKDQAALDALKEGRTRVQTMSLIHQDLYRKDNLTGIDVRDYLGKLTNNIFNTYQVSQEAVVLSTEIDPLNLDVDTIVPLGLIINELITNAMKYAFPEGKGSLFISLKEVGSTLQLQIQDDGVGFTGQERTDSFGFELIEALLDKLDGELRVTSEQGTAVDITLKNYRKAA